MTRPATLAFVLILAATLIPTGIPRALAAEPALHAVSGVVLSDSGEPLSGAYVYGYSSAPDGSSSTSDKAQVGDDGTFTLHLGDGAGSINANYEKWPQSYANQEIKISGADVSGLKLVLNAPPPKTAVLVGTVLGPNGEPIEGATVTLGYSCCIMYAKPEAVSPPPSEPVTDANSTSASSGSASSGTAEPAIARPIYCCPYYNDQDSAVTGADGKFKLSSYGGQHSLTASAKGYAQSTIQVDTKDNATVTNDIKLLKVPAADGIIDGRVLDAKTGLPIANAGVSLNNLEWSRYLYATTGADGKFHFENVLPGWSEIDVYVQQNEPQPVPMEGGIATDIKAPAPSGIPAAHTYYAYSRTLAIEHGQNAVDVKLQPRPDATVALLGYVVDPNTKKGVEGANVNVWDQDTGDWGSAVTDTTGSYKIMVRPGHFTINAYAPGHLNGALTFVINSGETTKRIDVQAPAGESHYAGCDDADCRGYPTPMAYSMDASKSSSGGSATLGAPAPAYSSGAPENRGATQGTVDSAPTVSTTTTSANGPSAGPDSTKAAAFSGTGGGLPAYDAASAPDTAAAANGGGDSSTQAGAKTVSAAGIVLVLGIAGVIALAARRRA